MKKSGRDTVFIVLGIGTVLLLGVACALAVLCFLTQWDVQEAEHRVTVLEASKAEKENELTERQAELESLSERRDTLQEEIGNLAGEQENESDIFGDGTEMQTGDETADASQAAVQPEETAQIKGGSPVDNLAAGEIIPSSEITAFNLDQYFRSYEITEGDAVYTRIEGKSYQPGAGLPLSSLRYLKVLHYNFNGEIQVGELIVNAALVDDYISAFTQLFDLGYQIQSMYLVDNYWDGDADSTDSASIDVNNTSCFNYRQATGSENMSQHAFGNAIDINPQQNPYVWYNGDSTPHCAHANAVHYLDRSSGAPHVITYDDACYQVFISLGFSWGGDWTSVKDYQHFEKKTN